MVVDGLYISAAKRALLGMKDLRSKIEDVPQCNNAIGNVHDMRSTAAPARSRRVGAYKAMWK